MGLLKTVQKDFDLTPGDSVALENEIVLTILAFEPIADLAFNIKNHTSVSNKIADHIAEKVNTDLLGAEFKELLNINAYQNEPENTTTVEHTLTQQADIQLATNPMPQEAVNVDDVLQQSVPATTVTAMPLTGIPTPSINSVPTPESEPTVQPMRTMQQDVDKVHGYGAYREIYPGSGVAPEVADTKPEVPTIPPDSQTKIPEAPIAENKSEDAIISALSQADTLAPQKTLTETPIYNKEEPT